MNLKYNSAENEKIRILGRHFHRKPLALFWTGSGIEVRTDSSQLWFDVETDACLYDEWISIYVDGFLLQRILLTGGRTRICAFRNFPMDCVRRVQLLKETQPFEDDEKRKFLVHGIEYDGELYLQEDKKWKFEFVGDSLSAGEGLTGSPALLQAYPATYGLTGHYAIDTAAYFDADYRILAQGGWGVHCSCRNDLIHIMPKYYEQVCGIVRGSENEALGAFERNDFESWQPDVVIVNLGSNDGFALDREAWIDPEGGSSHRMYTDESGAVARECALVFEASVVDFLEKLRKHNPDSWLIWAYGMCDHRMRVYIEKAVNDYKLAGKDEKVSFLALPATTDQWVGSAGHPGVRTHKLASEVLIEHLKRILDEKK